MKCIHLGDVAGVAVSGCCGGKETTQEARFCKHSKQSADFCIVNSHSPRSQGIIELAGDNHDRKLSLIASCGSCEYREQPVRLPSVPLNEQESKPTHGPKAVWMQRALAKLPPPNVRRVVVVDGNKHGIGDLVSYAWIAEGVKDNESRLLIRAQGEKAELLRCLGHEARNDLDATADHGSEYVNGFTTGNPPMIRVRARLLGFESEPQRPSVKLPQYDLDWAESSRTDVILFPQSKQANRTWPESHWYRLNEMLQGAGYSVSVSGQAGHLGWKMKNFSSPRVIKMACLISKASLVIGNDSGPMHIAGTLGTRGIALLGRTSDAVFSHMNSVRCMSVRRDQLPCVNCWGNPFAGYDPKVCDYGCKALSMLEPEQVFSVAAEELERIKGNEVGANFA